MVKPHSRIFFKRHHFLKVSSLLVKQGASSSEHFGPKLWNRFDDFGACRRKVVTSACQAGPLKKGVACKQWPKQSWSSNLGIHQYIQFGGAFLRAAFPCMCARRQKTFRYRHNVDFHFCVNRCQHICLGPFRRSRADQGGFKPPERAWLQTSWVRKSTTPHPMGNWSWWCRGLFFNNAHNGTRSSPST